MSTGVVVSLADYLRHTIVDQTMNPDCDYLEGRLEERNAGGISHGDAQGRTYAFVLFNGRGFWAGVAIRVQVRPDRYRVPDVVIVRGGRPPGRIITDPPELAVEILSSGDRAAGIQDKIDDYLRFGISAVWLIDLERQRAWLHTPEGAHEVMDRVLRNPAGDLELPLSAVFPNIE